MVDVDKAVIARLKIEGRNFEILVDCDKALSFKQGMGKLEDVLATREIFKDVKMGEKASEDEMQKIFNTTNPTAVAEEIIKKGEVQLTQEHKKKLREEKKKQIINIISRNAIDSKTGLPHPPERIERTMEETNVKVDEFRTAEEQIQDILSKLREKLPIKFETREIAIKLPSSCAAKSYRILKNYGKIINDEWQTDGSLVAVIEIPAGMQEEFFDELNKISQGEVETKLLKRK